MSYQGFKNGVLGRVLGDSQCVALIDGNSQAYVEYLWPGVQWTTILAPVVGAKDLSGAGNPNYLQWIENDHNDPNQLPQQGDIMVFDATPQAGYANTYNNPYGHTGICESASSGGFALLQQNAPSNGAAVNVTNYNWKYRPCKGWLRPKLDSPAPAPVPTPSSIVGHDVWLHAVPVWHVYRVGTQPVLSNAIGYLRPANYNHGPNGEQGLTYTILGTSYYANTVTIQTDTYGRVDIYLDGDATIL